MLKIMMSNFYKIKGARKFGYIDIEVINGNCCDLTLGVSQNNHPKLPFHHLPLLGE